MKSPLPKPESSAAENLVRATIEKWRSEGCPDAAGFLSANPEVRDHKSLAMDLIYEEYCLRHESGETLAPSTFCQKFPTYRQSLRRLLDVHQFMDAHPEVEEKKKWRWPEQGESVLGFKVIQKLGEGAIAKVYLAHQPDLGQRRVVVKISRNGATEAKLLGKLEHPSIVPIHSVHQDAPSGLTCICMPFLGTATLVDLLDLAFSKGKPPQTAEIVLNVARQYQPVGSRDGDETEVAPILRRGTYVEGVMHLGVQLAEALAAAHDAGVMHRDIKPSNVLLSRGGRPMLLDFNLSTDLEMPMERVGGTVAYMAPERIQSLIADKAHLENKLDPRSDVYSLAALLYELLCGELPSRPEMPAGKQVRLEEWLKGRLTPPGPPSARNPAVDRQMETVVLKGLSPDPADRYPSAAEFAKALRDSLTWKARAARSLQRNRRTVMASAAGMLVIGVAAAFVWANGESDEDRWFREGEQAYSQGDSKAAVEKFTLILEKKPKHVTALFARGQAYRQGEDFVLAQRDYQAAFDQTGDGQYLYYVGFCELKGMHYGSALGNFEAAQKSGYTSPQLLQNTALCYYKLNRRAEAASRLEKLLDSHPEGELFRSFHLCARSQYLSVRGANKPLPPTTLEYLEKALSGISDDPLLSLDAACIYLYQASRDAKEKDREKHRAAALKNLRDAISAGASKLAVEAERTFLGELLNDLTPDQLEAMDKQPQVPISTPLYYEPSTSLRLPSRPSPSSLTRQN
ncbi:MAG: protein kinase domain-containing protein [Pirellulaceae bacterium]